MPSVFGSQRSSQTARPASALRSPVTSAYTAIRYGAVVGEAHVTAGSSHSAAWFAAHRAWFEARKP